MPLRQATVNSLDGIAIAESLEADAVPDSLSLRANSETAFGSPSDAAGNRANAGVETERINMFRATIANATVIEHRVREALSVGDDAIAGNEVLSELADGAAAAEPKWPESPTLETAVIIEPSRAEGLLLETLSKDSSPPKISRSVEIVPGPDASSTTIWEKLKAWSDVPELYWLRNAIGGAVGLKATFLLLSLLNVIHAAALKGWIYAAPAFLAGAGLGLIVGGFLAHELGHFLLGWISGATVELDFPSIHPKARFKGGTRAQRIAFILGGPLTNLLTGALWALAAVYLPGPFAALALGLATMDLSMGIGALLPFNLRAGGGLALLLFVERPRQREKGGGD